MSRHVNNAFIYRTLAVFGAILLLACGIAYGLLWSALAVQLGNSFSESFYTLKGLYQKIGLLVWFSVVLYGIVAAVLILVVALFATHKVAGPLYRLEMLIDEALRGKIPRQVRFRQSDQIQPLADAQGRLFAIFAEREDRLAVILGEVEERRSVLTGRVHGSAEDWRRGAAALEEALQRLAGAAGTGVWKIH
jgi:hypothetical protein